MQEAELEKLLLAYETDVRFPDVSGMEHLDTLLTRTRLEQDKESLTSEQQERLAAADQKLMEQVSDFHQAITKIANLESWREQVQAPSSHWWWYLDVLVSTPSFAHAVPLTPH